MKIKSFKILRYPRYKATGNYNPATKYLNKAGKRIYDFLDDHIGIYHNQQEIEFIVHIDNSVSVAYAIKDPPLSANINLGLCYDSNSFSNFMYDFQFTGTRALKALSPDRLWEMYYKGQAEIYCIFEMKKIYFALYFKLNGNTMVVHDDYDNEYELGEILQMPRQFAAYTRQQAPLHVR